ncbi:MAG: hypothetical protein B6I24_10340 [Bacteroidetes bacterium 4572_128]|nr:MAG: hypothetical protein B6I24_10340 [Bacteroidetes bacterium 4572_128]
MKKMKKKYFIISLVLIVFSCTRTKILTKEEVTEAIEYTSLDTALQQNHKEVFRLNLSDKELSKLPEEVLKFKYLQVLVLKRNNFEIFPEKVLKLKNLQILELGQNKLKSIPSSIEKLKNLKVLTIDINKIESLPEEIGNLKKMKYLNMDVNKISELPESMKNFTDMRTFVMRSNRLKTIYHVVKHMPKLELLWIYNNPIKNEELDSIINFCSDSTNIDMKKQPEFFRPEGKPILINMDKSKKEEDKK